MKFNIITLFPEIFEALNHSIIKRAREKKLINLKLVNLRDFGIGKHKIVDDTPYGGGPGMVLKVNVIDHAIASLKIKNQRKYEASLAKIKNENYRSKIILLTPQGKRYTQADTRRLSKYNELTLICGHYEGFDERVRSLVDEEISIGDYVLTGGELAAMVLIDSISRLLPGILGKDESSKDESFSAYRISHIANRSDNKRRAISAKPNLEYPQYTRPEVYKGKRVPKILLSGNHQKISEWREKKTIERSKNHPS